MTREEKCKLAIERGYTYDPETGLIYNRYGKVLNYKSKGLRNKDYILIQLMTKNKCINLRGHQFAWYWVNKECVDQLDHINGIRYDNRILNLRAVNTQQNHFNRTTAKGYYYAKDRNKWRSYICVNKKDIYLGSYNSEQEARNAYLAAKEIYHKI